MGLRQSLEIRLILLKIIQELHWRAHYSSEDQTESEHLSLVSSVLSANRHRMYFNIDSWELFPNTFPSSKIARTVGPMNCKRLSLGICECPNSHITCFTTVASVFMGPTSTDSATVGGTSSEDSHLHVDLSPTNRRVPFEQLLYFWHLKIVT